MKLALRFKLLALCALISVQAFGAGFGLTLTPSATSASVGNDVNYVMSITNGFGVTLQPVRLTLEFPTNLTFVQATNDLVTGIPLPSQLDVETTSTTVVFTIGSFVSGQSNHFAARLKATSAGTFTLRARVARGDGGAPEAASVNLSVNNGQADLGVSITGLPQVALAYDLISYNLVVTNRGPSQAPSVILTNIIPPNAVEIFNSAGTISTVTSNQIVWNLGTLTNAAARTIRMVVQPITNGNFALNASLGGRDVTDTGTDQILTNLLVIQPILTNNLELIRGTNVFNRNTALIEETITVRNTGPTGFAGGVRIFVAGMESPHRLFNVAGTNGLTPYVAMTNGILPGASVPIKMQYYFKDRTPHPLVLTAVQGPTLSTNIPVNVAFNLTVPTNSGPRFAIQVSDTLPFPTNATILRTVTATNNSIALEQLISRTNAQRFYRAIETQ